MLEYFEDGRTELYNLVDDPGESNNQATAMPDKARALQQQLAAWRKDVGARMPKPNPAFAAR